MLRSALRAHAVGLITCCLNAVPAAGQPLELIVRNGTIVTVDGSTTADIGVRDGVITEIGTGLSGGESTREIDAGGRLVLPGGIDPHVHLGGNWVDDYTSGSAAALAGGITTISNFVSIPRDVPVTDALGQAAMQVGAEAIADVILHPIVGNPDDVTSGLEALAAAGYVSLKVFMVRPAFDRTVPEFLNMLDGAGDAGILTMLHSEDAAIVSTIAAQYMLEGRGALQYYADARPPLAEVVATQRAVAFSEATGAPVYLVHVSSAGALAVAEAAQARGLPVYVETRPIFLHETRDRLEQPYAGLYVSQPPLRTQADQDALWNGLARGVIHTIGTDHVPYTREQKLDPTQTVQRHRAGSNNLQVMRPMLYSEGVRTGRITLEQFVAVTATNPAKLFGLYPAKGTIAVGADADLVLWDPEATRIIRDEDALSNTGFSIYAGREVTGWPVMTIRRGKVVYENGAVTGAPGTGRLAPRTLWQRPALN
jgi:dihydropyrimidinase